MSETDCPICANTGWVCENHPDRPWGTRKLRSDACECGAGKPCICNPLSACEEREEEAAP